jgi:hypothetical protein
MSRTLLSLTVALFLLVGLTTIRAAEEKKTDLQTTVAEGKEITLMPAQVSISDKPDDMGRFLATVKPGKDSMKVKMPAQVYGLGFYPEKVKEGLKVVELPESTSLRGMRTVAGKADEEGPWSADPGDIITHINGNPVNSVEELLAAVSTAKDKKDVQIVLKDVNSGDLQIFYITATKK